MCNSQGGCNSPTEKCLHMAYFNELRNNTQVFDSNICLDLNHSHCEFADSLGIYQDSIYLNDNLEEGLTRIIDCSPWVQ